VPSSPRGRDDRRPRPGVRSVILREYIAIGGRLETRDRATELQRLPERLCDLIIKKE